MDNIYIYNRVFRAQKHPSSVSLAPQLHHREAPKHNHKPKSNEEAHTMTEAAPPPPPNASSVMRRRIASFPLIILLWTAARPFTPVTWLMGGMEGGLLVDHFVAGALLVGALYFQWQFASLSYPVAVALPNPLAQNSASYIHNGRMGGRKEATGSEIVFYYHPHKFWRYIGIEAAALALAEWGPSELLRRGIAMAVVGCLWAIGWIITPERTKRWVWERLKVFWFYMVINQVQNAAFGGGRRRTGRRF